MCPPSATDTPPWGEVLASCGFAETTTLPGTDVVFVGKGPLAELWRQAELQIHAENGVSVRFPADALQKYWDQTNDGTLPSILAAGDPKD